MAEQISTSLFTAPARLMTRALGKLSDDDRARLRGYAEARALDADAFNEEGSEPFFAPFEFSNDNPDSYGTRMMPDSLDNFARDAGHGDDGQGIAVLDSHNSFQAGIGRTLSGQLMSGDDAIAFYAPGTETRGDVPAEPPTTFGTLAVRSYIYIVPGMDLPGGSVGSTDDFIRGIRTGILRDASVGFHIDEAAGGRVICSVCGSRMVDSPWGVYPWDCDHYPGLRYEIVGDDGVHRTETAWANVFGAHAGELSIVYKGATPEAGAKPFALARAMAASSAGLISRDDVARINHKYAPALRAFGLKPLGDPPSVHPVAAAVPTASEQTSASSTTETASAASTTEPTTSAGKGTRVGANNSKRKTTHRRSDDDVIVDQVLADLDTDEETDDELDGENTDDATVDPVDDDAADDTDGDETDDDAADDTDGDETDGETPVDEMTDEQVRAELRLLRRQVRALRPHAANGIRYHRALVERALKSCKRAGLNPESYRSDLNRLPATRIIGMTSDWESIAKQRLPAGRQSRSSTATHERVTSSTEQTRTTTTPAAETDDRFFKAR